MTQPETQSAAVETAPSAETVDSWSGPSRREPGPALLAKALRRVAVMRGWRELALIATLYVGYSLSRTLASGELLPAEAHAETIVSLEHTLRLAWESTVNLFYARHATLGLVSDYWYCTAHYVLTPAVLIWLYRKGPHVYRPMRRALVAATAVALVLYLLLPTAPPRFLPGYLDVLALHQHQGWWGQSASAPKGMGGATNQLAAFPSMHAGYALWVAISLHRHARSGIVKVLGWAAALMTAATVIGTANHWVLDVLVGWVIVLAAVALTSSRVLTRLQNVVFRSRLDPELH